MTYPPNDVFTPFGIDHTTQLITAAGTLRPEPNELASAMVANCLRCRYLSAGVPELFSLFQDALGPGIPDSELKAPFVGGKSGISTCGLFAEHMHALLGVDDDRLYVPYAPKRGVDYAVSRLIDYSTKSAAWVKAGLILVQDCRPDPGDVVVIGTRSAGEDYHGIEHELVVCARGEEDTFWCVEAGQVDENHGGLQCVKVVRRQFDVRGQALWCRQFGSLHPGRKVLGWSRTELLPLREHHQVPMGWVNVDTTAIL